MASRPSSRFKQLKLDQFREMETTKSQEDKMWQWFSDPQPKVTLSERITPWPARMMLADLVKERDLRTFKLMICGWKQMAYHIFSHNGPGRKTDFILHMKKLSFRVRNWYINDHTARTRKYNPVLLTHSPVFLKSDWAKCWFSRLKTKRYISL